MKKHFALCSSFAAMLISMIPLFASAACATGYYCNPFNTGTGGVTALTIPDLLLALVDLVFLIGVPIIVMFIIYAGFLFVTAGDNEAQISRARTTIMWTLLGALVLLGAKAISAAIQATVLQLK